MRLPKLGRAAARNDQPSTDKGERIYAIGDVHGRYDLLRRLLDQVERHERTLPPPKSMYVVLLGDLIDRGPDSAKVLSLAHAIQQQSDQVLVLLGNHEELMLRVIDGEPGLLRAWLRIGGRETLASLGIEVANDEVDPRQFGKRVAAALPRDQLAWLRGRPVTARSGDYLFCHAGLRPGVAIKQQRRSDLLWIRDEFLKDETDHGVVVVHGHSVVDEVDMRPNRIGIDTGAYRTGVLTALYLEGTKREIISTSADGADAAPVVEALRRR